LEVLPGVALTYHDAGHILGSASIQLDYHEQGKPRRFVFTGDLGRRNMGLLPDPTIIKNIDILVTETTYGHRELDPADKLMKQLHAIVARAIRLRSKVVIPAFSLGRTQRMIYCLQDLFTTHKLRPVPVYVDSPLAMRLTDIHRDHPTAYTPAARRLMDKDPTYFGSKYVEFCASWDDSRRLNYVPGPMVIVASSGMCEAGRIRHHLRHLVSDPDNAIVIVSYQAEGTLGRQLAEGAERVQIMDQWYDLNAAVYVLDGFSGHADRNDLAWWFEQTGGGIEHGFLVHGEPQAMEAIAPAFQRHVLNPVVIPELLASFEV
jgi:metallo-beta-lactamase family protein